VADHRRERVEHLLRAELAALLLHGAKDPRLAGVTISAVRLTADLRQGRVFFRVLGDRGAVDAARRAFERAAPFLQSAAGRSLGLRVTPTLRFEYDTTPDTASRVDALLRGARRDRDDEDAT
jgi:ribosome-binding factor A